MKTKSKWPEILELTIKSHLRRPASSLHLPPLALIAPGTMQRAAPALLAVLAFLSAAHAFCPAPAALRPPSVAGSAQLGRVLGRLSSPGSCRGAGGGTVRGFVPRVARGGVVALRAQAEEVAGEVESHPVPRPPPIDRSPRHEEEGLQRPRPHN